MWSAPCGWPAVSRRRGLRRRARARPRVAPAPSFTPKPGPRRRRSRPQALGRQGHDVEPVVAERLERVDEVLERDRLGDERVGAEVVGAAMSRSARDALSTTIGMRSSSGSDLSSRSASRPSFFGMLRSSRMTLGNEVPARWLNAPSRRRYWVSCTPSSTKWMRSASRASPNASSISARSSASSSAISTVTGPAPSPGAGGLCRCATGSVKTKVAPRPGLPDALIVPPWRSRILRQVASPMPVPA